MRSLALTVLLVAACSDPDDPTQGTIDDDFATRDAWTQVRGNTMIDTALGNPAPSLLFGQVQTQGGGAPNLMRSKVWFPAVPATTIAADVQIDLAATMNGNIARVDVRVATIDDSAWTLFELIQAEQTPQAQFTAGTGHEPGGPIPPSVTMPITASDGWHHFEFVLTADAKIEYHWDGQLVGTSSSLFTDGDKLRLELYGGTSINNLGARLDNVRVTAQ
jgi:hypothetical protein